METQAYMWAKLRAVWMEVKHSPCTATLELLRQALNSVAPLSVPNLRNGESWGDSGNVLFPDSSSIHWDWDNGDFECGGLRLEYPFDLDDPLYW